MVLKLRKGNELLRARFREPVKLRPAAERLRRRSHSLQRANNALHDEERREKDDDGAGGKDHQHHGPGGRCTAVRGKAQLQHDTTHGDLRPDQVIALKQTDGLAKALAQGAFKEPKAAPRIDNELEGPTLRR